MAALNSQYSAAGFIFKNKCQIRGKAQKLGIENEDANQDFALFILENGHKYDPTRGSFDAFVFGNMEKIMRRQTTDVLRYASSLDDQDDAGALLREQEVALIEEESCQPKSIFSNSPEAAVLLALADFISGKSISDISAIWGVTKRRVNQILKRARDDAQALALFQKKEDANG